MTDKQEEGRERHKKEGHEAEAKGPEATISKDKLAALEEGARKSEEHRDNWLRALAELENTKKRLSREKEEFMRFANEDIMIRLLPIADNFERALASVKVTKESDAILQGVRIVQKELAGLFRDYKVEPIECMGKKFDPHLCEAIATVQTDEHPEDTVIEQIQAGYTLDRKSVV